ncbi:MAG: MFS transporter [Planctomycetota bacterium]|nr:MFS transporter [Planctomycetota bacterium]
MSQPAPADKRFFRLILYLIPALLDCITGIFVFIGPVRTALMGHDPLVAGSMVTARSAACCLVGFLVSRFLTVNNAVRLMFFGNIMLIGVCLLGVGAVNLTMLYATSALVGVFQVIFFSAFQLHMKSVDADVSKPLERVVGTYTLAWCSGMSIGPFLTGFLMRLGAPDASGRTTGWVYAYLAAAALTLAMLAALAWVAKNGAAFLRRPEGAEGGEASPAAAGRPDLAWLGWCMGFVGLIAAGIVKGVFPSEITRAGMPEWRAGSIMMAMALVTGGFGFLLSFRRRWLYSGASLGLLGLAGTAGLAFFVLPFLIGRGLLASVWPFYAGAILFGAYSGVIYLYSCFHSLSHPEKASRNIALNECFISGGGIIGPLLGGWLAGRHGFYLPFGVASLLILLLAVFQWRAHRRYEKPPAGQAAA